MIHGTYLYTGIEHDQSIGASYATILKDCKCSFYIKRLSVNTHGLYLRAVRILEEGLRQR